MKNLNYTFLIILLVSTLNVKAQIKEENILNVENHKLDSWQLDISRKETKNILDYYLLLPKQLFETEIPIFNDSEEFRKKAVRGKTNGKIVTKYGYLIAQPFDNIEMALFKDRTNNIDIIGFILGCGEPPIQTCSYGFIEFNSITNTWKNRFDIFPWKEFYEKCEALRKYSELNYEEVFWPNLILPEQGTTVEIIDVYGITNVNFRAFWNGTKFIIK
ncbi:hypothetical protein [Wenyingzhuangia sp. 2_MG-2023]|uniref:hypothetical protein n=1 Tax=Wenyingzhuangia sp. 2_MG-2023 TaxID=3062639 RepID=UPI0026E2F972|nr:hypothetical protein [Wenyingzhuangia sp. 2_MG-2023]MDO6739387.1 hypothetical protein [Wenyingzhuangia sp. 2_MG-2023]